MNFSNYIIYVDESGDHSLDSIDRDYPVFVLDFCIFQKEHYISKVVPAIQAFKFKHFGHDLVILHEHGLRKQIIPFVFLQNQEKRRVFMEDLNTIVEEAGFTVIAAAIHKQKLADTYRFPENPYEMALRFCMERAFAFLKDKGEHQRKTHIIVEKRGKREDDALELSFRRIRDGTNKWGPMPGFELVFADKRTNSAGLQLADLTARPIGRYILDSRQPNRAYEIIERKFRRNPRGVANGWGLKIFP